MPDVVARVLVEAGREVFLCNVLPKKSVDSAVLDYATANASSSPVIATISSRWPALRAHSGLIIRSGGGREF